MDDVQFCLQMETKFQVCAAKSFTLTIFTPRANKNAGKIFILLLGYEVNLYIYAELGLSGMKLEHTE